MIGKTSVRRIFGQLHARDDVAQKLDVPLGAGGAFLKALEENFLRAVALPAEELAMHHDALVQRPDGGPESPFQHFLVRLAQALRRKGMSHVTPEMRHVAFLLFVERAIALRT